MLRARFLTMPASYYFSLLHFCQKIFMKIIGFLLATASINVKLNTKMGNNNLGPVADGYNTDTHI